MLQEPSDQGSGMDRERRQKPPAYVGAPSEYADAAEVPESVGLLAKIVAGGVLSWSVIALVVGLLAVGCAACFLVSFLAGSVLR
jgi:hypothetical protein